ncbi:MAG: neutral zinc metallopeptidase [Bacteroidaceae bacterium]|nr:neutral zinc metallopeptidase [Bacteroidaceae bacterium]MCI6802729.1 neutral zinc metallopeptidase [Prevotellaceae bacterium]MBQ8710122.1 neutral zinc metallopeptidase [Bacteroidaceae bacterium]MBR1491217.1 neutral zinc metallopeptidase [Bacteroidaceae bacterium]MBS7322185.1 neutral zinc metallopeptidase [Bacteroidaceae bacterium]
MRLDGRRESSNVDDRRGGGFRLGGKGGLGIGAAIVIGLITYCATGDLNQAFQVASNTSDVTSVITGQSTTSGGEYQPTAEEQELESFAKKVLASTEDVWTEEFKKMGKTYEAPTLVFFNGSVQSGCGGASASTGPFYCSADQCVYIDLSFFTSMKSSLGADGDFAYAYVIAHEVGHHVQYLLGNLGKAHAQMAKLSQSEANKVSVQIELQADCFAGVWAYHEQNMFGSLEEGDLEEAISTAQVIGDDYLQKKAQGYVVPESFNHGTSQQRMKWFKRGFTTGDISQGNTFAYRYEQL